MDPIAQMKQEVAAAAAGLVQSGMVVGLGSGSTAAIVIELIGARQRDGEITDLCAVPTSFQATQLAIEHGIRLVGLNEVSRIDLAIDGADEVDPQHVLIKGGGGCHTREKLVDARAEHFTVVVDSSKLVDRLGSTMPLPIEVLPDAYVQVMDAVRGLGGEPELRMAVRKAGPVVTDQGNLLIDARFAAIPDPAALERDLNNIPGVLDNGLFVGVADQVLVGEVVDGAVVVREA